MASKTVLKDKKIGVYKKVTIEDSAGFQTTGYMPINESGKVWAYFKQLSASLVYQQQTYNNKEECIFRINWNDTVRNAYPSDLAIGYKDIVYDVVRVDPFEDYTRDLVIYAKTSNRQKLQPILPYDPDVV